jgi:hypothetical protein
MGRKEVALINKRVIKINYIQRFLEFTFQLEGCHLFYCLLP